MAKVIEQTGEASLTAVAARLLKPGGGAVALIGDPDAGPRQLAIGANGNRGSGVFEQFCFDANGREIPKHRQRLLPSRDRSSGARGWSPRSSR